MCSAASLGAAREELERARNIVAELRASLGGSDQSGSLSQLEAALSAAGANIDAAERQFEQRISELSSLAVGSNVRHF